MPAAAPRRLPRVPGAGAWSRALHDLPDVPYKVKTNARGQLILSLPKPERSTLQPRIDRLLFEHLGEVKGVEFAVRTSDGVEVPGVVWISAGRRAEIPDKRQLYFEGGAREVWVVERAQDRTSRMPFFEPDGEAERSTLALAFPQEVQA